MDSFWKGAFTPLRKHIVSVAYVPIEDMRVQDFPTREELEGSAWAEAEDSEITNPPGYFKVVFDELRHLGGTYFYPATEEQVREFEAGTIDPGAFYGW